MRRVSDNVLKAVGLLKADPWYPGCGVTIDRLGTDAATQDAMVQAERLGFAEAVTLEKWVGDVQGWKVTERGDAFAAEFIPGYGPDDDVSWMVAGILSEGFSMLLALDQAERRRWMRGWMARRRLFTAGQAAPVLAVSRQTVERMLYPGSKERIAVSDQALRIAYLVELGDIWETKAELTKPAAA